MNIKLLRQLFTTKRETEIQQMFNKLWSLIFNNEDTSLGIFSSTTERLDELLNHVANNYSKDHDSYNAALDTICDIIQEHKHKISENKPKE
jgi:hypothetical protein